MSDPFRVDVDEVASGRYIGSRPPDGLPGDITAFVLAAWGVAVHAPCAVTLRLRSSAARR